MKIFLLIACIIATSLSFGQFYTGSYQEFGKNRVQYYGFDWKFHKYQKFTVYYYGQGEKHAAYSARLADKHLKELQKFFEYYVEEKLEILVFNSHAEFKMSNIGITTAESSNIGGVTHIQGTKLFVYYEGDHRKLAEQIRAGIAEILVQKMLYGDDWKDAIKSSTLMSLPSWYTEGFTEYIGKGWNTTIDAKVKDGIITGRYTKFNKLEGEDARLAGHSMWNFIAEKYGQKVLPQIFYMARISRSIENGFLFVLGMNLNALANDYINFYRKRYQADNQYQSLVELENLNIKNKRDAVYTQYKVSPNGDYAAFVSNQLGQYKVWIYDLQSKKLKRIYKKDYKLDRASDYSHPVINWHPTLNALVFFTEYRGLLEQKIYTLDDGKTTTLIVDNLNKVLDFAYNDEGTNMILSAVAKGQTDIYMFKGPSRVQTQLTDDIYDDLHPRFVKGSDKVIFSSNRVSDTLPQQLKAEDIFLINNHFDIFIFDPSQMRKRTQVLQRITNTPYADEFNPYSYDKLNYTYVSDRNGVFNRYVAQYDSAIAYIDTVIHYKYFATEKALSNYQYNVLQYNVNASTKVLSFMTFQDGVYNFFVSNTSADKSMEISDLKNTTFIEALVKKTGPVKDKVDVELIKLNDAGKTESINIDHYQFEDDTPEFEKEVEELDKANNIDKQEKVIAAKEEEKEQAEFELPGYQLYKTNFAVDYLVTQFDNQFLFQSYQRYAGPGAIYFNPGFNGLVKMGVSDLFEDYKLVGGFRMPIDFESGEYLITYDDLSGRIDHKVIGYRNSFRAFDNDFQLVKVITHELKYRANFAIDEVQSVRTTVGYRNDRNITKALENISLDTPDEFFHNANAKVEYVFDAVRPRGLNLYNGTRFKIFGEYYKELTDDKANTYIVGADFRHYQRIYKDIIYAGRFAGSYSFGDKKLVYYLGGVDNWIFRRNPSFDDAIQVPSGENFAFQTVGTPVRGFVQNIRNGSNFAVINNEVRIPVVKMLMNKPVKSDFLENFQVIGFSDIGAAWTGTHPYSDDNAFNTIEIDDNIYHIEIENLKDPVVWGYGFGLRSRLFGYFVRFDWAWGIDDGARQRSIRYLSLSLDF